MKDHKEMFEALLNGETLIANDGGSLELSNNWIYNSAGDRVDGINANVLIPSLWKIKPKTININGFEVPEPVRKELDIGDEYYLPEITNTSKYISALTWNNDSIDYTWLKAGLIHLTEENANIHKQALLSFTKKGE